jgi:chloramphenicol-sensitive protein RarD
MPENPENRDTPKGLALAVTVHLLWGGLPLYLKLLDHIPPSEVVAHRILWSVPLAGLLLIVLRRTADLRAALMNPRMLGMACVTAALISVNWGIYVWAITSGHAVEAALGYYINPLFSIFLGAVLLGERLSPAQMAAIALAAAAVVVLTVSAGRLPIAALGLTVTWGIYAFFKKWLPIGPNQGFLLEVLILSPFALAWVIWLQAGPGLGHFGRDWPDTLLRQMRRPT